MSETDEVQLDSEAGKMALHACLIIAQAIQNSEIHPMAFFPGMFMAAGRLSISMGFDKRFLKEAFNKQIDEVYEEERRKCKADLHKERLDESPDLAE